MGTASADISEMEHRISKSIAQLTLCQVTGEEIETATELLEKACQKLRGIPEVPPQRITDLNNRTLLPRMSFKSTRTLINR